MNLKAHTARDVERLGQRSSGARAERCAGFCRRQVLRALDAHDALDVRDDAFPILLEIRIDLARKNVFHEAASLVLLLSHQLYPSAQPANSPQSCYSRKEDGSWTSAEATRARGAQGRTARGGEHAGCGVWADCGVRKSKAGREAILS